MTFVWDYMYFKNLLADFISYGNKKYYGILYRRRARSHGDAKDGKDISGNNNTRRVF